MGDLAKSLLPMLLQEKLRKRERDERREEGREERELRMQVLQGQKKLLDHEVRNASDRERAATLKSQLDNMTKTLDVLQTMDNLNFNRAAKTYNEKSRTFELDKMKKNADFERRYGDKIRELEVQSKVTAGEQAEVNLEESKQKLAFQKMAAPSETEVKLDRRMGRMKGMAELEETEARTANLRAPKERPEAADQRKAALEDESAISLLKNFGLDDKHLAMLAEGADLNAVSSADLDDLNANLDRAVKRIIAPEVDPVTGRPTTGLDISATERGAVLRVQERINQSAQQVREKLGEGILGADYGKATIKTMHKDQDLFTPDIYAESLPVDSPMAEQMRNYFTKVLGASKEDLMKPPLAPAGALQTGIRGEQEANRLMNTQMMLDVDRPTPMGSNQGMTNLYERRLAQEIGGVGDPTGLALHPSLQPLKAIARTPADFQALASAWPRMTQRDRTALLTYLFRGQDMDPIKRARDLEVIARTVGMEKTFTTNPQEMQDARSRLVR